MGPFLSAIIAAFLATLALDGNRQPDPVDRTTATVLAIGLIVFAWASAKLHHARPGERARPPVWARPFDLLLYALLLFETDWTTVAREASLDLPLLRHVLVLAPYFLAALARVDAALPVVEDEEDTGARGRIVIFHAKLLLIPILPLLVIQGAHDLLKSVGSVGPLLDAYPAIEYGVFATLFVLAMLFMPAMLSWVLSGKRFADGPLRSSLEADLARQKIRVGGIEEVDTRGLVANAAYLGISLRLSRIFISDALLHVMPADEIRAVMAHEVAHGTRRHLVWFLLMFIALMLGSYVTEDLFGEVTISRLLGADAAASTIVEVRYLVRILAVALPFIGGLLAFVAFSRRFEVEADLVGAESIGDPELFNRALFRVAAISGKPLDRHGLRHYSIASRTEIVRACAADPALRARWTRTFRKVKLVIACFFALVILAVAWKLPRDLDVSRAKVDMVTAESSRDVEHLRSAAAGALRALPNRAVRDEAARIGIAAVMALADEALKRGDFDEARRQAADVEANWPAGDIVGDFNRKMLKAELAAIDPNRDLASVRPDVQAAQAGLDDLLRTLKKEGNESVVRCEQDLRFLAAATGVEGATLEYEAETFESSRLLALARGARIDGGAESREATKALAALPGDDAWRRTVLERALGNRSPAEALKGLVAAETRKSSR